jgi:HEAT repeat protein
MGEEWSVEELVEALWHDDREVRTQAIEALGEIGEPAVPALLAALREDDRNYDLQCYENPDLRRAIVRVGEPAFRALLAVLGPGSDMVRAAAKALQLFDDPRAVEPLISAMLDEQVDPNGRLYAINALGAIKDPRAFESLVAALSDPDIRIRSFAARALAEYGDLSTEPLIREALENQDASWRSVREGLLEVLRVLKKRSEVDHRDPSGYRHILFGE